MVINRIIPVTGISKMTDSGLLEYAGQRIQSLTEHDASFPGLTPTVEELNVLREDYEVKLSLVGKDGTPSATANKNESRRFLENGLQLAAENCAEIAGSNSGLFLLSGFGMKAKSVPVSSLPAPTALSFKQGPVDGSVYAYFKPVKNAKSYEIWVGPNNSPETWTKVAIKSSKPILITDLTSLSVYFARCRAIGSRDVKSEWSSLVEFKVM